MIKKEYKSQKVFNILFLAMLGLACAVIGYGFAYSQLGGASFHRAQKEADEELRCSRISLDLRPTDVYCGNFWKYYFEYLPSKRIDPEN